MAEAGEGAAVAVTPLTTIAAANASAKASEKGLATAIEAANTSVAETFGLSGIDIDSVIPADMTESGAGNTEAQNKYGAVLSGLTQLAETNGLAPEDVLDLVKAFSEDYTDGTVDGKNASGAAIETALSLTPAEALNGLNTAIQNFLNSPENLSGFTGPDVTIPQL